jgi:archaellum biogenesis protein FlaJ (TadC family)
MLLKIFASVHPNFNEFMALALCGYLFHILKIWAEKEKRKEEFITRAFLISVPMNLIAIFLLIYITPELPEEWFVPSKLSSIIIGFTSSSALGGIINIKKPQEVSNGSDD